MRKFRLEEHAATLEARTYAEAARAALRRGRVFLSEKRLVGLRLPSDAPLRDYVDVVDHILATDCADKAYVLTSILIGRRGDTDADDALDQCLRREAVVVLIPNEAVLPPELVVAFDSIIDVEPVSTTHLIAATRSMFASELTAEQAERLLQFPHKQLFRALRRGRPIDEAISKLEAAKPNAKAPSQESVVAEPRVEDLEGYGAAKDWALDLIADLQEWRENRIAWQDVPSAILLSGPPGTGKTMFARALAVSCNAKFIATSCAQWQAKGHLGDMLAAMRKCFREAAADGPSVLLIDEIDSIGDRAKFSGHSANYCIQVVNALLELLDGADRCTGVIVVAATNYAGEVDPALRRPGRLDRHVAIELPDDSARRKILAMHLPDVKLSADELAGLGFATSGFSGAQLRQLAADAKRKARRERREIRISDITELIPAPRILNDQDYRVACIHEAGHAVVCHELGTGEILRIVVFRATAQRRSVHGFIETKRSVQAFRSQQSYTDEIAMLLGGLAAETVVLSERYDGAGGCRGSDLQRAADIATEMIATLGMGDDLSYAEVGDHREFDELRRSDPILRRRVERLLAAEYARALEIVGRRRQDVERVAAALSRKEFLSGDEFRALVGDKHQEAARAIEIALNRNARTGL